MGFNSGFKGLINLALSGQIFEKSSNIKFHENSSSGSRVVPCGRTDMTKLTVAFRNFLDAPKKVSNRLRIENSTINISLTGK